MCNSSCQTAALNSYLFILYISYSFKNEKTANLSYHFFRTRQFHTYYNLPCTWVCVCVRERGEGEGGGEEGEGQFSLGQLSPSLSHCLPPSLSHTPTRGVGVWVRGRGRGRERQCVWVLSLLGLVRYLPLSQSPSLSLSHTHTHTVAAIQGEISYNCDVIRGKGNGRALWHSDCTCIKNSHNIAEIISLKSYLALAESVS